MSAKPWLAHYDKEVPASLNYTDETLFDLLTKSAQKYPQQACTLFKDQVITYRQMDEITDRLAAGFYALGVRKGDRVGLSLPNIPQFVAVYFGLLKAGAVVVATNPLYTARELLYQLKDAGASLMVALSDTYETIKSIQGQTEIKRIVVTDIMENMLAAPNKGGAPAMSLRDDDLLLGALLAEHKASDRPDLQIDADDVALFQYSGGTTGISKGVVAPHRAVVSNVYQVDAWICTGIEGEERVGMVIPLYHVYGMVLGMNYAILKAATLVLSEDSRKIDDVLDVLSRHKVSIYPGVPAMYNAIIRHPGVQAGDYDLSSIKVCISGSAPLLRETKERFEDITGGKLLEGYGLSEAPTATHCNPVLGENRTGSIGLPWPDVDCRIVDVEDGTTDLSPGEIGELLIQGPQVMRGYHNMPQEMDQTLENGWLHTGDIAYMDEDGYFYIVDRKKELIKPGGLQVWPSEVEEVLSEHPDIKEAGAAGIPDELSGEAVKAWLVLNPGASLSTEEVRTWCRENLAPYKVPKEVEFVEALPRSGVGKLLRRELVRWHNEGK